MTMASVKRRCLRVWNYSRSPGTANETAAAKIVHSQRCCASHAAARRRRKSTLPFLLRCSPHAYARMHGHTLSLPITPPPPTPLSHLSKIVSHANTGLVLGAGEPMRYFWVGSA